MATPLYGHELEVPELVMDRSLCAVHEAAELETTEQNTELMKCGKTRESVDFN